MDQWTASQRHREVRPLCYIPVWLDMLVCSNLGQRFIVGIQSTGAMNSRGVVGSMDGCGCGQ